MPDPNLAISLLKPEEAEQYMRIRHEVFRTTINNILYSRGEPSQKTLDRVTEDIRDGIINKGILYLKCVDISTGEMVAGARWRYVKPKEEGAKERTWEEVDAGFVVPEPYDESDPKMFRSLFTLFNSNKREILGKRPYYVLDTLVTLQAHERRGAGSMLVRWGCGKADEVGVEAFLEASPMGAPMYARHGFQPVKEVGLDLRQWGGKEQMTFIVRVRCVYKAPPPARRRKKGVRDIDVATRLRVYEDALLQLGVEPEDLIKQHYAKATRGEELVTGFNGSLEPHGPSRARKAHVASEVGVLVREEGRSRYLENGLWTSLQAEIREPKDILDESSDDEVSGGSYGVSQSPSATDGAALVMGVLSTSSNLLSLHPTPVQIFKLWQSYLRNIHPLVKICHTPTTQQLILDASDNLHSLPRDTEALLFAIYCITVESLEEDECLLILGEPKGISTQRFRQGAQHALANANFLRSSSVMLLQAFTMFILSLQDYDARVIWIFSGIAQRIGQRIGLHRDGDTLRLPPFEAEIRRRLWWQIMVLEGYSQKLAGTGTSGMILRGDVGMPSNINDSDLFPGMREMPKEHDGATEMMFFLIRCYVGNFLKRSAEIHTTFDGLWHRLSTSAVQVAIKEKAISELETLFERKFLCYCDPAIPWHLLCMHLAKSVLFMMRFMAHSTDSYDVDISPEEKDMLFDLALQVSASQNLAYTTKELRGFRWHVNLNFQWKAFIYLISELRHRVEGEKVDHAWAEVEKSYTFHPSFDKDLLKRAFPIAVDNLTIKAWDAYQTAQSIYCSPEPRFIELIRQRHRQRRPPKLTDSTITDTALPTMAWGSEESTNKNQSEELHNAADADSFDWAEFNASLGPPDDVTDLASFEFPEQMIWSTLDDFLVDFRNTGDLTTDFAGSGSGTT
ncbi:hypothetical protein G6011_08470 [Alternaria panax]|uniref:Xylanolytic transcriptional activator regulatory domain-containing protein n=1 Tax=Alternaria panax TaxID=48097 RepID=A0AAD4FIE1_9PLEO|nr:hypothetical protein G6011_08470 [Alternaria panax]